MPWVEFVVGSGEHGGYSDFPPSTKTITPNSNLTRIEDPHEYQLRVMWLSLLRLYFIYFIYLIPFSWLAVVGTPDIGEEITEGVDESVSEQEEESSCSRLLAAAAERVWDIFVQNKREVSFKKVIVCFHKTHSEPFL